MRRDESGTPTSTLCPFPCPPSSVPVRSFLGGKRSAQCICVAREYAAACVRGLHEGAAAGGQTHVHAVSRVPGRVSPGCRARRVSEGPGWPLRLPSTPALWRGGGGAGQLWEEEGRNPVPAHPQPHKGLPPNDVAAYRTALTSEGPTLHRENQRLQKLRFPDSRFGPRAYSWLLDSISNAACDRPGSLRKRAHHGPLSGAALGPFYPM